jgi:hypothetical protein
VASTVADKALRCCMYYELMKDAENKAGKDLIKVYKTDYGIDLKKDSYTKACNNNFPTQIAYAKQQTYSLKTGIYVSNAAQGAYELK